MEVYAFSFCSIKIEEMQENSFELPVNYHHFSYTFLFTRYSVVLNNQSHKVTVKHSYMFWGQQI